ncbi:MAG: translation elongation factor Ts [Anaerolineales bacterium]|uniref:Elongation factor Ts n=1 Tax=Candidatus Desulfolinea nitratireducens TaxID=2841698 RepID=A0A8J6TGU9_9CHLR|nr:translation elongation factor Ts [Candidatus Desulfolinea nitratireducens]MBL6959995.1 translation elongation factor Ts [Anaerolineales bacterium]
MEITTEMIRELRATTGVGILECRKALQEADGDYKKAIDFLREKGMAKAAKRADRDASDGVVELYSHGDGRVGVMLEINCETDFVARGETFRNLAHEIALQIAAASPLFVTEDDVPADVLEHEADIARKRSLEEGKPENIIDKIVEGRLKKYKEEVCLMQQKYIRDDNLTIKDLVMENVGSLGENIVIRRFQRWELGEHLAD